MADDRRDDRDDREGKDEGGDGRVRRVGMRGGRGRRKVCRFCADKNLTISYKDVKTLRLFITETGKMTPRRISGTCAKHQRPLALEIKRARQLAMLPLAPNHF